MNEEKTCATCRYFYQHYVKSGRHRYDPIKIGHCGNPRFRDKRTDTPACRRYAEERKKDG